MTTQRVSVGRGLAASLAVTFLVANVARADYDWILQPTSTVTFTIQVGATDANNNIIELYNGIQQTDPGTSLAPGYTNGLVTNTVGTVHSIGNSASFLTSLNFGDQPAVGDITTAKAVVQNNGIWLPATDGSGTSSPGDYGSPVAQNAAVTMSPVPGFPDNVSGDAGRVSLFGTFTNISSSGALTGDSTPGNVANPQPIDVHGHFDARMLAVTGGIDFSTNLNGSATNSLQIPFLYPLLTGTTNWIAGTALQDGFITRGTGVNSYQYVIHSPLPPTIFAQQGPSSLYLLSITASQLVAAANLRAGDVNFDGIVNGQDIAAVASHWLNTNADKLGTGDANGDGIVNGQDIAMIASNYLLTTPALPAGVVAPISPGAGGGGSGSSVPEPSTWLLLGLGGLSMLLWRRRTGR